MVDVKKDLRLERLENEINKELSELASMESLLAITKTPEGMNLINRIIQVSGVYKSPVASDVNATYINIGKAEIGRWLIDELSNCGFVKTLSEPPAENKVIKAKRERVQTLLNEIKKIKKENN